MVDIPISQVLGIFCIFLILKGKPIDFVDVDDSNKQWVADFSSKSISMPHRLEAIDGKVLVIIINCVIIIFTIAASKFIAVLIPSCPGAPFDLANNQYLASIMNAFLRDKSKKA